MHRLRAWGLAAALLGGLGGVAHAGETTAAPSTSDTGFRRWNGIPPERPKPPPLPSAAERAERRAKETAAALRAQEEASFLRRLAVCDRLRQLALETGDDTLEKQADLLQEKAESLYKQKTKAETYTEVEPRESRRSAAAKAEGKR